MQNHEPNVADARLEPLIGEWDLEGTLPVDPPVRVHGRVAFEWLEGQRFVVERWTVEHPEFPNGIAILGDGETGLA
ncbi:MAG: hypothetical protein M3Q31_06400, partial [Actinomycetota bacterium]|nr:hypothetical protein [Actinomycetota bacterium]